MKTYGLIGFPLSHSFSQKYFTEKFHKDNITDCEFKNFSLQNIDEVALLLKNDTSLSGLSITIPHKQSVMKFLSVIDSSAKEVGAVNCIKRNRMPDGQWHLVGHNTDVIGFEQSLRPLLQPHHTQALILGTGGAAKAVAYILDRSKIKFKYVSRIVELKNTYHKILSYETLSEEIISESPVIINTTPLGMFPNINTCPDIPYEFIKEKHLLYDLNYNPEETLFLKKGKEKGAKIKNGLEMLHLQAEAAWEIWNKTSNS